MTRYRTLRLPGIRCFRRDIDAGFELSDAPAILIGRRAGAVQTAAFGRLALPVPPLFGLRLACKAVSDASASRLADATSCGIGWPAKPRTNPGSGRARK